MKISNLFSKKNGKDDVENEGEERKTLTLEEVESLEPINPALMDPEEPPPPDRLVELPDKSSLLRLTETIFIKEQHMVSLIIEKGTVPLPFEPMRLNMEAKRLRGWTETVCNVQLKAILAAQKDIEDERMAEEMLALKENRGPRPIEPAAVDAKAELTMSSDSMVAWLFIFPPVGKGEHIKIEEINQLLDEQGITHHIDEDYIREMVQKRKYLHLYPVAAGLAPVDGDNGKIVEFYARERICVFTPDADGNLDYRAQNYFQPVFKDGTICRIHYPTAGVEGVDLRGRDVVPKAGKPAKVPQGKNTHITEDGSELVSDMDGDVIFEKDTFMVRSAMVVNGDVDYSTGNINFMGDVHIKGNVRDKFIVRATGSVMVDGLLESAIIDADGDVIIAGGVLGDGGATIRSRGNVRAKFMESCTVYAGSSLHTDYILTSKVFCDGPLTVTTGKGVIMGGVISVHDTIESKSIGSPHSGRTTVLKLGSPICGGGENFVGQADEEDELAEDLLETATTEEGVEGEEGIDGPLVCARSMGRFTNVYPGVTFKFGKYRNTVDREWNSVAIRFDVKNYEVLIS